MGTHLCLSLEAPFAPNATLVAAPFASNDTARFLGGVVSFTAPYSPYPGLPLNHRKIFVQRRIFLYGKIFLYRLFCSMMAVRVTGHLGRLNLRPNG